VEPVLPPHNLNQIQFDELLSHVKGGIQLADLYKGISDPSDLVVKALDYTYSGIENDDLLILSKIAFFCFNAG